MATFDEKNGWIYTLKFLNTSLAKNYWSTKTSDPSIQIFSLKAARRQYMNYTI